MQATQPFEMPTVIILAMAHTFHIRRTEIWCVRRDGAWFSRIAHGNLNCYVLYIYNPFTF